MRPKFLTQSHTISRNLSCISRPSLRSLYISEHRTKRQPLQAACGKNPTAIRPVPMHENRDLPCRRRRRKSSPSHKLHESQFKQMSTISHTCAHTRQPLHPPQKGLQRGPCAATASAVMRPKFLAHNLTHSLVISRVTLLHLACPSTPSNALKMLLTSIPSETGTLPINSLIVAVSPALTQYAIAPNLLLPPCKSLHHRISCTHRRKTKAAADHLCTLTNVYGLTEQPQLQDHRGRTPPHPTPHAATIRKIFFREQRNT